MASRPFMLLLPSCLPNLFSTLQQNEPVNLSQITSLGSNPPMNSHFTQRKKWTILRKICKSRYSLLSLPISFLSSSPITFSYYCSLSSSFPWKHQSWCQCKTFVLTISSTWNSLSPVVQVSNFLTSFRSWSKLASQKSRPGHTKISIVLPTFLIPIPSLLLSP